MKHIFHSILNNGNGYHKSLNCPHLRNDIFDVLHIVVSLDKFLLACADTLKVKPTVSPVV